MGCSNSKDKNANANGKNGTRNRNGKEPEIGSKNSNSSAAVVPVDPSTGKVRKQPIDQPRSKRVSHSLLSEDGGDPSARGNTRQSGVRFSENGSDA